MENNHNLDIVENGMNVNIAEERKETFCYNPKSIIENIPENNHHLDKVDNGKTVIFCRYFVEKV